MKINTIKIFSTAVILFFSNLGYSQNAFNLKITVKGVPKDSLCRLANYYGDKQYLKDSALADAKGTVVFKAKEKLPGGIYLFVLPNKKYFEFIIDKEQNFSLETDTADLVKHMKVTGSRDNELFFNYIKFINEKSAAIEPLRAEYDKNKDNKEEREKAQKKIEEINKEVVGMKLKFMEDNPDAFMTKVFKTSKDVEMPDPPMKNPDGSIDSVGQFRYYKAHFFDNLDLTDERMLRTPVLFPKIEQYVKKLTVQMPDSINEAADYLVKLSRPSPEVFKFIVWWITNQYETSTIMGMDAVFVHMAENYYTKDQAYWADSTTLYKIADRAKTLKPILIGKKVRNLVLLDTAGTYQALYNIKKPFTVLIFWDPDCGHCQKEMPKLKELYDKVKSKGVEVYAVDNEVEEDKWKKFIREHNLNWINVADLKLQNNFRHEYDLISTPQIFLLDENKTIVAKRIDVATLGDVLQRKLDELAKH
ncbi:MAG: redoxin domain-containing protein [Bacteroidia bacterium]